MKRRRRENTGDALLIYTVLATPIRPPTHTRATHIFTHTHICTHNHATPTTFSYATGARNRHPFQDRDIWSEVTTLFPRSRHPERGDDTLSKIETSGARCRHQQRNQTTKPNSSTGTCAVTETSCKRRRRTTLPNADNPMRRRRKNNDQRQDPGNRWQGMYHHYPGGQWRLRKLH